MESDQGTEMSPSVCGEATQCVPGKFELEIFEKALGFLGGKIAELKGKILGEFGLGYANLVDYVARSANELDEGDGVFRAVFLGCAITYIKVLGIDNIGDMFSADVDKRMKELEKMH